jgi:hypothetical protein
LIIMEKFLKIFLNKSKVILKSLKKKAKIDKILKIS